MKTFCRVVALVACIGSQTACASFAFFNHGVPYGALYANGQANEQVSGGKIGSKHGEACATSILGLVTLGDASVSAAAKAGGITTVSLVDNEYTNIIGVYAKYCLHAFGE